jgi:hypothetical protein
MKIPLGVRCVVYSFLKFEELLGKISRVSMKEREAIVKSKILDQERQLEIPIRYGIDYKGFEYALKLANGINLVFYDYNCFDRIRSLNFMDRLILEHHTSKFNIKHYNVIKGLD